MIDFALAPEVIELRDRVRAFVREVVIPSEARDLDAHGLDDGLRAELQERARAAGVFAPHVGQDLGGLGLDFRGMAVVFEEAGYSVLGPQALNCAAPDEGNMHLLEAVATKDQKERYLRPLAQGDVRSCFAMTEPAPGAGSDPSMLRTHARRVNGGWSIDGRKWFITGATGAAFAICMARTDEGATMFLVDADNPGWRVVRVIDAIDRSFPGGHAEVVLDDCRVGDDDVLGAVGADLGMVQERVAESVIDIETTRLLIWRCAWALDHRQPARHESSVAKAHAAEAVGRVVDRAVQICGSLGVSGDAPLARLLAEVRPFRIYDGPTETHHWAIARRAVRRRERERTAASA
jgi:acyl-CoA dehydrogenase